MACSFQSLIDLQAATMKELFDRSEVAPRERHSRILLALGAEVGELTNALADEWKWWAGVSRVDAVENELADVFLFVLSIAAINGISADQLIDLSTKRLYSVRARNGLPAVNDETAGDR